MTRTTIETRKTALQDLRVTTSDLALLEDGAIRVRIQKFGFSANNVTYGVLGDRVGYWNFFPTEDKDWGVIPVWGIGVVEQSNQDGINVGERLYGYWPMSSHIDLHPSRIKNASFFDGSEHRTKLAAVYNRYMRLSNDPNDDPSGDALRMVLWPLYATSFCLYDFSLANDWFGAQQVLIGSASSKTGIGTGYAFKADPNAPPILGLTSEGNRTQVEALKLYDTVLTYDEIETALPDTPTLIIDMSGSGPVISRLHKHLGDNMRFTSHVGLTHHEDAGMGDHYIRTRSEIFFAPGHIAKRSEDWGRGVFEEKSNIFWKEAARHSSDWLQLKHAHGPKAATAAFNEVLSGQTQTDEGWTITLP